MFEDAVKKLHECIHEEQIIPSRSTVDPEDHPHADWAFARHWYSTWVDTRTKCDESGRLVAQIESENMDFRVCRLPIFESYRNMCRKAKTKPRHPTCWGEWYLAIQRGSESVELGIEVINNLMTSRKVAERALSGAGLPLQRQFYSDYGDTTCFGVNKTYKEIQNEFFKEARSRTQFIGFRLVTRILSGRLKSIIDNPKANVGKLLRNAFAAIDSRFDFETSESPE